MLSDLRDGYLSISGCPTQWFILLFTHDERRDTQSDGI
jgi:hypothetical protein